MKKIRIGNTVALSWEIFIHDGDEILPYDLTGKAISVYLINAFATVKIEDFITEDNVLSFTWEGSEQRFAGVYQLTLVENENTDTMLTFDECEAFELVRCSCSDDEDEDTIEKVELSSKLNMVRVYPIVPVIGPNSNWWVDGVDTGKPSTGMSAYEFAKENGYTGTEEEYAAECAAVPTLNEESREAADNADRAAGEARRGATMANSAAATATDAAEAANTAAESSMDQIEAVGRYIGSEVTPAAEAAKLAATKAINAAEAANNAAGSINGATDNANSAAEAANAAATRAERAIEEFGPAIANKADLENGKIVASQIPDYLLGQVVFGGLIYINNSVIPTVNFDDVYGPFYGQDVIIDIHEYYKYEGVYFIAQDDGIILDIDVKVGDWIVSTGYSWEKIDNTDAVSSVAGLVGNVNASSLAAALADLTDSNSLARKTDLPKKLSELENDIEIGGGGGGGSYDDSEIKEILSNIVDEEGYLYSNGEKVDMRFTRSLLPVGTSIPASANLNTIEFLKIGKYYCSLNADAKTIKNCPVNVAFSMEVFNPLGTNVDDETTRDYTYRLRVLTQYDTGQQYMQFCRTNGTAGSWIYDSWYVTPRVKFALASSKNDGSAAIGASNKGVYVDSTGEIKAMSYTVAKSVPSNAVFTDTNTKVTAVENHYAPAEDESQQIDAPSGEVVTGIKRDAAGHVVGVVSTPQTGGGDGYLGVYGDGYIESEIHEDGTYLITNVAENLDEVSARGQLADAYDIKTFVENAVQGGGGSRSVYKWVWNYEMTGAFIEEEFENLINADVIYISVNVAGTEVLYTVDAKLVVENALHLSTHSLSFERGTDNNEVAYVESITFIFDNSSKTWGIQGGNAELITNEQLANALEGKQDIIEDLEKIRQGAAKGDTALQSVPSEYVTETELNNKGYATTSALNNKVDKVSGKQLSTQDFTTELKGKLKGIEANAQKNVQSDWSESDTDSDTYVNNRTHYSYDIEQVTSFSIASKNQGDILVTGLHDGVFYRIINYACGKNEAFHFVEGRKVVIPSNGPTIDAVCAYEDDYCLKLTTPTYGMTESFVLKEVYVEQLDDVYVPETIARKAEIATINGQSLTEGGDITIEGGGTAVDNVYITDFKVEDLYNLKNGEIESLQIDRVALSEAIIAKKTILVPYDDGYVGGYSLLLGEVADAEIYFSIYTYVGQYIYVESYDGVVIAHLMIIRDLQVEHVQQTNLDTLKRVANANAVQTDGLIYAFPDQATGEEDEVLLSRGTVKTINGQYLLADENSNDITVAYPEEMATSSSMALKPNTVTVWAGNVTGTIDIAFALPLQGYVSEYIARFTVAADGVQLVVPDRVVWADSVLPAMTPGKTYEISFLSTSGDNSITATFLEF